MIYYIQNTDYLFKRNLLRIFAKQSLSSGMHVTGAVKGALTSREVRLWISGKYLFNSSSKTSRCWIIKFCVQASHSSTISYTVSSIANFPIPTLRLQLSILRMNFDFDFVHKIDYQASFPLEFQVQCVQLSKYVNKIG